MQDTKDYLLKHGIKPSQQRLAVMRYLLTHPTHPTANEIYEKLLPEMPTLTRATVYNTLGLLAAKGAILTLNTVPGQMNFDACTAPHAHLHCTHCGQIYDASLKETDRERLQEMNTMPESLFKVREVQLVYKGVCLRCMTKMKQSQNNIN